ncbi:4-hydroxyproline epimerase [Rubripirellula tenax]|uniref:4-hydroxyproline epimerase n=1 Tax=Rubripirellula tenax TaxID=2528015 RepID=A0A5C6EF82_9BACT|nr:proline racemase family protein [Rubripirellula tenax]TWU46351.1 4-hydroxyproline epimerase [Rubripirellula tenax]
MLERDEPASSIEVIDSHTEGEPTRVVVSGIPDLGVGSVADQLVVFREQFDHYRRAIVREPRGNDVMVGALMCKPLDGSADIGVIFFNNVGYLGMCGHGMIGVITTLKHRGQSIGEKCRVETPVGIVTTTNNVDGSVSFENIESYRLAKDVTIDVPTIGEVIGDVAWGGNWFFLVTYPKFEISLHEVDWLQRSATLIRKSINESGYPEVDHVELFATTPCTGADSQNFVLCPGLAYDRSPCGTGTSAKLACLAADGTLAPDQNWVQAGILGTTFEGRFQYTATDEQRIRPVITGRAFVTSQSRLHIDPADPFAWGIDPDAASRES